MDRDKGARSSVYDTSHTVLLHSVMDLRYHSGNNVVAQRHGPGPRLRVELAGLVEVACWEAVRRAADPLRA